MKTIDFEKELKEMNPDLGIFPNPNNPGLSNIKLNGKDICPVPSEEIKEESDPYYNFTFQNGMMAKHKSRPEALSQVQHVLKLIETEEGRDLFFK